MTKVNNLLEFPVLTDNYHVEKSYIMQKEQYPLSERGGERALGISLTALIQEELDSKDESEDKLNQTLAMIENLLETFPDMHKVFFLQHHKISYFLISKLRYSKYSQETTDSVTRLLFKLRQYFSKFHKSTNE